MIDLTDELRRELQGFDTPTVCNALEVLAPARRGAKSSHSFMRAPVPGNAPGR